MTVAQRVSTPSRYPAGWLVGQLPVGMRDDELLVRFVTIFERVAATLRAGADGVEHAADVSVTTPQMLSFLSGWLGYDVIDAQLPVARQREIVSALGRALPLRGTAAGLRILLEAITGDTVEIDEPGCVVDAPEQAPPVSGVVVHVASPGHLREHELRALVRDEVPAHLPVKLIIGPQEQGDVDE